MKHILALGALVCLSSPTFAAPMINQPVDQCLETSKQWIYRNMIPNVGNAVRLALDFCGSSGRTTCLDPALQWIYRNTARSSSASAEVALNFCKRGDVTCLEPAKQWIYRNSGGSPAQAAELAIKTCSDRLSCDPDRRTRPSTSEILPAPQCGPR